MPTLHLLTALSLFTQQPLEGFDAYAAKAMADWRVPGMAIVVVKDDSVAFIKGYGVRELGKPDPVTVHTRFGIMSTTKAFTAMLVAMLADSGKLSLDDPVQKHLPDVQFADPYVTREIALRDLLTHRVGFADPDYLWGTSGLDFPTIAHRLRFVPVQTSFRTRWRWMRRRYSTAATKASRPIFMPPLSTYQCFAGGFGGCSWRLTEGWDMPSYPPSGWPGRPPGGSPRSRWTSSASCLPSACSAASSCG